MRKLLIGTMCLMLVLVGTSMAGPEQAGGTCATATPVPVVPWTDSGVLDGTDDCVGRPYFDVFYVFTAPVAGTYIFDMCGSTGDTYMKVWTAGTCCVGTSVTADDQYGDMDPILSLAMTMGQIVYVECGSYASTGMAASPYLFHIFMIPASPIPNETCATATVVNTIPYSNSGILGVTDNCVGTPYFDVFYVLTAPVAGNYTFDMCGSYGNTYMKIWTAGTCCSGTSVTDDNSCPSGGNDPKLVVAMTLGQTAYIECGYYTSTVGFGLPYTLNVAGPPPPPANETCAGAINVATAPYSYSGILGYTDDCVGIPYFDTFFKFTAPIASSYIFDMCNSYGDTYMKIWTDGTCCVGNSVTADNECGGSDPRIVLNLAMGQMVYVECGFYTATGGATQAYYFNISIPQPGDNCALPLTLSLPAQLPYSDIGQRTCGRFDDYNATCLGNYDGGEDIIYEVTVTSIVTVDITLTSVTTYIGMCIDDMCPPDLTCIAMSTNSGSGTQSMLNVNLTPGTYYIMVDTWPSPTCIPSFDLNIVASPPPPPPYYWANSCGEGTGTPHPSFNWANVTTNALTCGASSIAQDGILGDDDWEGPFPIGFTFTYYNMPYTTFCIGSNGFLMLGNTGNTSLSNVCIPATAAPNNMLAWFWDDMDPVAAPSNVYYGNAYADGQYSMVVTFVNYRRYTYTQNMTAQVILKQNDNIKYQYQTIDPGYFTTSSTIGIESQTGVAGINYLCNGVRSYCFQDNLAIEFGPNQDQLPVELTSFDALAMNEAVRLAWVTASETNNDHFVVSRSTSLNGEFTQIATINGAGASATESNYNYVDRSLINGVTYYYRLADVDINGNVTTHDLTVNATPARGAMGMLVNEYKLHQNFPNPFNPNTTIVYDVKETGHVTLKIYNLIGQEVVTLVDEVKDNNRYQVTFDASGLAAGVYFYRVNVNDFSSVHKMILLK